MLALLRLMELKELLKKRSTKDQVSNLYNIDIGPEEGARSTKFFKNKPPNYFYKFIPETNIYYTTRNADEITVLHRKWVFIKNFFLPLVTEKQNSSDKNVKL